MKILIDGRMYGTAYTGIGRYIKNLVDELQKIDTENQYYLLLRSDIFRSLSLANNWEKIEADYRHYSFKEQLLLPGIIHRINPDIVHFPHFNVPLITNKKFLVTIHDVTMHKKVGKNATTLPTAFYAIKRFAYHLDFTVAVRRASKIITPTEYVKKDILERFAIDEEKIIRIYEGLDNLVKQDSSKTSIYTSKFSKLKNKRYFVYVGNAYPHKNVSRLVEALAYLLDDSDFDAHLVLVVKNNSFRKNLIKDMGKFKLQKNVHFFESLLDDELGYLYSHAEGFLYPSLEEGFGLQGLEAIANNTLLAVSDIPVFKEVYSDYAIYFNPLDFSSIQSSMFNILNMKKSARKDLLKYQKQALEKYSVEKMAKYTLKVYNSVYESSAGL